MAMAMAAAMRLGGLYRYPVKSCAPLPAEAAAVEPRGLVHDRRWMVVDPDGRFITGRELPRLTLVHAEPATNGGLALRAPGMAPLRLDAPGGDARGAAKRCRACIGCCWPHRAKLRRSPLKLPPAKAGAQSAAARQRLRRWSRLLPSQENL